MNKKILILVLLLLSSTLQSINILNTSVPKCGTFLLMQVLQLIFNQNCTATFLPVYYPSVDLLDQYINDKYFACMHLGYKPEYEQYLKEKNAKAFFIYRDPRDQLVSQVHYMLMHSTDYGRFTFDSLLTALIGNNDASPQELNHFQDTKLTILSSQEYLSHIKRFYEIFIGWRNSEVCYSTRFEDLVGIKGGGSAELQKREIANIAKHAGIHLNEQQIIDIASKAFGGTWSFREGKIGSWRTHFKPHHVSAFKAAAGNLLIEWGYEPDNNWHL